MATKPYPSEAQDRFIVRMPDGMRDQIAAAAKANNRSMNAEIIAHLESALDPDAEFDDIMQMIARISRHSVKYGVSVTVQFSRDPAPSDTKLKIPELRPAPGLTLPSDVDEPPAPKRRMNLKRPKSTAT